MSYLTLSKTCSSFKYKNILSKDLHQPACCPSKSTILNKLREKDNTSFSWLDFYFQVPSIPLAQLIETQGYREGGTFLIRQTHLIRLIQLSLAKKLMLRKSKNLKLRAVSSSNLT